MRLTLICSLLCVTSAASAQPAKRTGQPPVLVSGGLSEADYPPAAMRAGEEGTSTVTYTVGVSGRVTSCSAKGATATLDAAACRVLQDRFIFKPAKNALGNSIAVSRTQRITWRLPAALPPVDPAVAAAPPPPRIVSAALLLTVGPAGKVIDCKVSRSSGDAAWDAGQCDAAKARYTYAPPLDAAGNPTTATRSITVLKDAPRD